LATQDGIADAVEAEISKAQPQAPDSTMDVDDDAVTQSPQVTDQSVREPITTQEPSEPRRKKTRADYPASDFDVAYSGTNTITLIHSNTQPGLGLLRYFDYDPASPNPDPTHPLNNHLLTLSWLQVLEPELDPIYQNKPATVSDEELLTWKASRRGTYHRKRRRWARLKFIVDSTRAGGFSGFVCASTMDPISTLRHALPLLAPGGPIAVYSPNIEPLAQLADCFSIQRRASWASDPPEEASGKTSAELERWPGTPEYPLNPSLLLGTTIQTSRARRWQVLPGRTHPVMGDRGGAEGYIFTAWKALPVVGKVSARGNHPKRKICS
jgi:tRNA (adenine-N(1)-)-methyltransferase non-catalytic subunit